MLFTDRLLRKLRNRLKYSAVSFVPPDSGSSASSLRPTEFTSEPPSSLLSPSAANKSKDDNVVESLPELPVKLPPKFLIPVPKVVQDTDSSVDSEFSPERSVKFQPKLFVPVPKVTEATHTLTSYSENVITAKRGIKCYKKSSKKACKSVVKVSKSLKGTTRGRKKTLPKLGYSAAQSVNSELLTEAEEDLKARFGLKSFEIVLVRMSENEINNSVSSETALVQDTSAPVIVSCNVRQAVADTPANEDNESGRRLPKRANRGTKRFYSPEEEDRRQTALQRRNSTTKNYGSESPGTHGISGVESFLGPGNGTEGNNGNAVPLLKLTNANSPAAVPRPSNPLRISMPKWHRLHGTDQDGGSSPARIGKRAGRKSTDSFGDSDDADFASKSSKKKKRKQSPSPERPKIDMSTIPKPPPSYIMPKIKKLVLKQAAGQYSVTSEDDDAIKTSRDTVRTLIDDPNSALANSIVNGVPYNPPNVRKDNRSPYVESKKNHTPKSSSSSSSSSSTNGRITSTISLGNCIPKIPCGPLTAEQSPKKTPAVRGRKPASYYQQQSAASSSSPPKSPEKQEPSQPRVILKITSPMKASGSSESAAEPKKSKPQKAKIAALVDDIKQVLQQQGALDESQLSDPSASRLSDEDDDGDIDDGDDDDNESSRNSLSGNTKPQNRNGLRAALIIPARSSRLRRQQGSDTRSTSNKKTSLTNPSGSSPTVSEPPKPRIEPRPSEDATRNAVAALEMELGMDFGAASGNEGNFDSSGNNDFEDDSEDRREDDGIPVAVVEVVMSQNQVKLQEVTSPSRQEQAMEPIVINTPTASLGYIDHLGFEVLREHSYCIPFIGTGTGNSHNSSYESSVSPASSPVEIISSSNSVVTKYTTSPSGLTSPARMIVSSPNRVVINSSNFNTATTGVVRNSNPNSVLLRRVVSSDGTVAGNNVRIIRAAASARGSATTVLRPQIRAGTQIRAVTPVRVGGVQQVRQRVQHIKPVIQVRPNGVQS